MKVILEQLLIPRGEGFICKKISLPEFDTPRHFHRELELKFMINGPGKAWIGENIYEYTSQDLVLIGSNLPHYWISDDHFVKQGINAEAYFLQFSEDAFGDDFFNLNELKEIPLLLERARSGIRFYGHTSSKCGDLIGKLYAATGLNRLIIFLQILDTLARSLEYQVLN